MSNQAAREQARDLAISAQQGIDAIQGAGTDDRLILQVAQVEAILAVAAALGAIDARLASIEREVPRIRGAITTGR